MGKRPNAVAQYCQGLEQVERRVQAPSHSVPAGLLPTRAKSYGRSRSLENRCGLTTSAITGLTLPGIMEDPGCRAGRLISFNPVKDQEDNSRKSLAILDRLIAKIFNEADTCV